MSEQLFVRHALKLYRYLVRKTQDVDLASDLVQETFLRVVERADLADVEYQPSYIFTIANNLLIDYKRKIKAHQTDSVPCEELALVVDEQALPEAQALHAIEIDRLKQALRRLPERNREVFILCRLEGWTYKEVAAHMGISASSVHKDMSLALAYLSESLSEALSE